MAAAKSAVDDATSAWTKAQAANTAGDPETAVASAHDAKAKAAAAASAMKMTLPAAPSGQVSARRHARAEAGCMASLRRCAQPQDSSAAIRSTVRQPRGNTAPRWARSPR